MTGAAHTSIREPGRGRWSVLALSGALALVFAAYAARVRAELLEQARQLGPQLMGFAEPGGAVTALEVNGARLRLHTRVVPGSVAAALDRFEALCGERAHELKVELYAAQRGRLADEQPFLGALREDFGSDAGVAVCLAPDEPLGARALLHRASALAQSGDLALMGQLRYAFARRTARGETHVLLASSEGPLPLLAMFPDHGDAQGRDLPGVPRPHGAERVLSAHVPGQAYGLAAYELALAPAPAAADAQAFARQLQAAGFARLASDNLRPSTQLWVRGAEQLVVERIEHGARPVLALVRLGAGAETHPAQPNAQPSAATEESDHVD
jgi:hypothetical protein